MPKIVTAHTGVPHITADDVGALNQKIIGSNDYLLSDMPEEFKAVMLNADTLQMPEAEIVVQGTHIRILNTDKVKIEAGQSGLKRIDFVVCRYTNNDGIENAEIDVVKGEASLNPAPPVLVQGDIRNGATVHEMPLFQVDMNGVSIEAVTSVCDTVKSLYDAFLMISEQSESIKGLNSQVKQLEEKSKSIEINSEAIQKINTHNLLWSGSYYMNENDAVNLSEPISKQTKGVALIWLPVGDKKENVQYQLILKDSASLFLDATHTVFLCNTGFTKVACKSVYVADNTIKGNMYNTRQGQQNGITFNNANYVLRYVIGF